MTISVLQQGLSIHGHMALDHGLTCLGLVDGGITASNGLLHIGPGEWSVVPSRATMS
ncbi:hypothetical protein [Cupriavidus sp. D39]|uniref:hypothetical protein n=1 Tax=Cupriavidus sp. D39 TaxID=2997877 RepID=UPI002271F5E9|nr:hypothetical protein [Cupriavidus sp. D39]MCY0852486.1 hypothetical protein [Cupriavidus sp. D39]